MSFFGLMLAGCGLMLPGSSAHGADKIDPAGRDYFEKHIRPVLVEHCYACHSTEAKKAKGGLQLDTRAGLLGGGDTGPAVVPGKPGESLLLKALRHEGPKMPGQDKKLPDEVIQMFEAWVKWGAPDPREGKSQVQRKVNYEEGRKHWAYQPVKARVAPAVKDTAWVRNPIDQYVLGKIESVELKPAPDAFATTLLRRLSFDLIGLPPTPQELADFEKAHAANPQKAVASAVDRLLASDQFGVHWARHWLDGIRFNAQMESAPFYRNWVVKALNSDMSYDRFVQMQLAGDLLPHESPAAHDDHIIATIMMSMNAREMDPVEGLIEVVGQQVLGVSIHCAKCHDHKYDAFTQHDYYALAGIFTSTHFTGKGKSNQPVKVSLQGTDQASVLAISDGKAGDTNLLLKGDPKQRGEIVPRRFPIVLAGDQQKPLGQITKSSGRLELAQWLTQPNNPLVSRVMANRTWLRLFGQGIVVTPNDFGVMGEAPTHPELLDYLAQRLVQSGWSMKALIRDIVLSRTYQQASRTTDEVRSADLENKLFTRVPFKRLQYEQIVDNLYAVAGLLDTSMAPLIMSKKEMPKRSPDAGQPARRAFFGIDTQTAGIFDGADPELLTEKRDASVTGPQMLFFLNNPRVIALAQAVARRVEKDASAEAGARVTAAYRLLFARAPTNRELQEGEAYLRTNPFGRYCHVLLCANEFIYLD